MPHPSPNDPQRSSSAPDAIGPHGDEAPQKGQVSGGNADGRQAIDFDDGEIYSGRGKNVRQGGTAHSPGGDSGRLGPPSEQLSGSNQPSDPDTGATKKI
ncbi:conserved hypothetical protein [Burkholderiales bacterium 8X]|nr:conserved hypothetical protein [Burkholderiales bacterium 8X]